MEESKLSILMYTAMFGVPLLFFIYALSTVLFPIRILQTMLIALSGIGLIIFGAFGIRELFVHGAAKGIKVSSHLFEGKEFRSDDGKPKAGSELVKLRVNRFNNEKRKFEEYTYSVEAQKDTTVLNALIDVKETTDPTLTMRYSCGMGICGSCGMVVNGKPSLACETNLLDSIKDGEVNVSPMLGHTVLKDLVTDFDDFFDKHKSVNPTLYRKNEAEKYDPKTPPFGQTKEQIDKFLPYSYCIMCGLCLDACPIVNTNEDFVGPQALSQAYRYHADSRDEAKEKRLNSIDTIMGVWGCEYAGSCSEVCPKGVDPATAIQLLKSDIMASKMGAKKDEDKKE